MEQESDSGNLAPELSELKKPCECEGAPAECETKEPIIQPCCITTSHSDEVSSNINEDLDDNNLLNVEQLESSVNIKRQSDSLALISSVYENSDSGSECEDHVNVDFNDRRSDSDQSDSEDSDSDDDDDVINDDDSETDVEAIITNKPSFVPKQIRVKGELGIKDLPPIEDLHISVKEEECIPFGKVYSIVDTLLVIQSLPDKPALNLDSIFFRHNGIPVGQIFDVFGPVKRPFYCIRFNTNEEIVVKGLEMNMVLYAAPETKHTQYVFANNLMKGRGSDASWVNDCEPPPECIDYSDDEEERQNKKKQKKPVVIKEESVDEDSPARKKYLTYEEHMNRNNAMRNKHYSKQQNSSSTYKRPQDIGWHNQINRSPSSSPSTVHRFTTNKPKKPFQFRPPLFQPPSSSMPIRYPRQNITFPPFNPYQPPPDWLKDKFPPIMPHHRFLYQNPSNCCNHNSSQLSHFPPPRTSNLPFQQNQSTSMIPPQQPIFPPYFPSPSTSHDFVQFSPGANSF